MPAAMQAGHIAAAVAHLVGVYLQGRFCMGQSWLIGTLAKLNESKVKVWPRKLEANANIIKVDI
jgi:hypothetical protein